MEKEETLSLLKKLSSPLDLSKGSVGIILAAGHGKRIKSEKSKMLHEIWGKPTVVRVQRALEDGLGSSAQIMVVGIKGNEVAETVNKKDNLAFVFQEKQKGTGDAVKRALTLLSNEDFDGAVYIVPGDMGLIDKDTISDFKESFQSSKADMMVLTGLYEGDTERNQYGRIVRVPDGKHKGEVVEIMEHKDILAMKNAQAHQITHKGMQFEVSKNDLLNSREFNTGIFGFKAKSLRENLEKLTTDNVQGELYITDLIKIFNEDDKNVRAANAEDSRLVEGFNEKSVLLEMEAVARDRVYELLKDVITIEDRYDFFIAEELVERILKLDNSGKTGDIIIHKGVSLGPNVQLSDGVEICSNSQLTGDVQIGANTFLGKGVMMSNFPGQSIIIGEGTKILHGNEIKGEVKIGDNCMIESHVSITGSDEYNVIIGDNVHLRGVTNIFGSNIEDGVHITHSVVKRKNVKNLGSEGGSTPTIRYILPSPEGEDAVSDI